MSNVLRRTPWGLPADLLRPRGDWRDPVHGMIEHSRLERMLLNSPPLQRLRRIHQLGWAILVYAGASHTRLAHSAGVMAAADRLLDVLLKPRYRRNGVVTLLDEWQAGSTDELEHRSAEARILGRLGALTHDICHVPFGHVLEDVYGILPRHDEGSSRLASVWSALVAELDWRVEMGELTRDERISLETLVNGELWSNLRPMILSRQEADSTLRYPWLPAVIGDTLCADMLDYIQRDHRETGLPYQLDDHVFASLIVTGSQSDHPRRVALRTTRGRRRREEVVISLKGLLDARRRAFQQIYAHHAVVAANVMTAKAIQLWRDHEADRRDGDARGALETIERTLLELGDDELVGHLARLVATEDHTGLPEPARRRLAAISDLARGLRDRKLFRAALECSERQHAVRLWRELRQPGTRARLEEALALAAGVEPQHVGIWVPPPKMWQKGLEDLWVAEADRVLPILESRWARDLATTPEAHRQGWAAVVALHRSIGAPQREILRRELARLTQAHWNHTK